MHNIYIYIYIYIYLYIVTHAVGSLPRRAVTVMPGPGDRLIMTDRDAGVDPAG